MPAPLRPRPLHRRSPFPALATLLLCGASLRAQTAPAPLPEPVRVTGHEIAGIASGTANINWEEASVADLPQLERLPKLRRLQINPMTQGDGGWAKITPEQLAPLAALPALEVLTIPFNAHLSVAHLQRLANCKQLTQLSCINEAFTLDAEIAGAFAAFPRLRWLDLSVLPVTAAGLAALQKCERLENLELDHCRNLDAACIEAVAGLTRLRSLQLSGVGRPDMIAAMRGGGGAPPTWALDAEAMRRLAAMPGLREISLLECTMAPHLLAELSLQLTSVKLWGYQVDAASLADLRRLPALRALDLYPTASSEEDRERAAAAAAPLLGSVHLERLRWYGALTKDVRGAIAEQMDLRELAVPLADDLGFLTRLPKLEQLELWPRLRPFAGGAGSASAPTAADFAPLRESKSLRRVVYHDTTLDAGARAALQKALGAAIELRLQ